MAPFFAKTFTPPYKVATASSLDSLHTFPLHLIVITSTDIILVILCNHEVMMDNHAIRPITHNCVSVYPKADKFHN